MRMNSPQGKAILAHVRGAAYAHAGEEEAIAVVMAGLPKGSGLRILDAGCGLGGTAHYLQSGGWGTVTGFDIDGTTLLRARELFPDVEFVESDVGRVSQRALGSQRFDLVVCFNSFYAFPNHPEALSQLRKLTVSKGWGADKRTGILNGLAMLVGVPML